MAEREGIKFEELLKGGNRKIMNMVEEAKGVA